MSYKALKNENNQSFIQRHIGLSDDDTRHILSNLKEKSLDQLIQKIVPDDITLTKEIKLPEAISEEKLSSHMRDLARSNDAYQDMIGLGYYNSAIPSVIQRNILENPGWYTAYTPYQAEISQGRLEALMNFQTMISDLTKMDMANASLLDEATAAAEAMLLAYRFCDDVEGKDFFVSSDCHPQTIALLKSRCEPLDFNIIVDIPQKANTYSIFGALFQYPSSNGAVIDYSLICEHLKQNNILSIFAADLLSLALLKPPGEMGADIVVGTSQRFGIPLGFGGPHAAFFAFKETFKRFIPGRIVGISKDKDGRTAYRLALQTREQHIRREKATSNICTAQVLLAIMSSFYGCYHGAEGLKKIAKRIHLLTRIFATGIEKHSEFKLCHDAYFDTVVIDTDQKMHLIQENALHAKYNLHYIDQNKVGLSFDESCTEETVKKLWEIFDVEADFNVLQTEIDVDDMLPLRTSAFMQHDVFKRYHSETEMMRYMRRLMNKDLALDQSMIPLGSCTMKLNSAAEMIPISLPGFTNIHPFRPLSQVPGYLSLIERLEKYLCALTGFDAASLQPNSGASGEYAGLMAIRGYHLKNGHPQRTVCFVPQSAHGTNPASAKMVGMDVVTIECDDKGNIDLEDLKAKTKEYAHRLAACMITYPSTHGVFEDNIQEVCAIIHKIGGQVYMDGANMNAQIGLTSPAIIGADVCHLNLHKTFCIPHGGGGPGVGPICVKEHLADFLPGHPMLEEAPTRHRRGYHAVSAAPFGSANILPISYAYIRMMGAKGLKKASSYAILAANYIMHRLKDHYPILYRGKNNYIAHEVILDLRPIKEETGVTVEDIAKRLMDYGFHAPTMSFPVRDTFMIEPTESESLYELDRFCDAMIHIRKEIDDIIKERYNYDESPLYHAPHTASMLTTPHWDHTYSRQEGVFPLGEKDRHDKYWPPVSRIDNAYGDRHLSCTHPLQTKNS